MNLEKNETSIHDLETQKAGLEARIKKLEMDLQAPLSAKNNEQALEISNLIILKRILEIERSNLRKVNFELEKKRLSNL
jgi:hypothetical protein